MAKRWGVGLFASVLVTCLAACGGSSPATQPLAARIIPNGISASLPLASQPFKYALDQVSGAAIPLNKALTVPVSGAITASGYAFDQVSKDLAAGVDVVIDGLPFIAHYQLDRIDVANYFKNPAYAKAGFTFSLAAGLFGPGKHELAVRVIANDRKSYSESPKVPFEIQ
jgi:hypothetical protein